MTSYLTANPGDAECIAFARRYGVMVPIARDGTLLCLVNRRSLDAVPLTVPLPVEDYVVGLEMLGFTFQLWTVFSGGRESFLRGEPEETLPPDWDKHALHLMEAFGTGRGGEVVAFLRDREEGQ